MLKNSVSAYGWAAIILHWLTALAIIALFALGLWMVGLTYYSPWYNTAPDIHRSIGILLILVIAARLIWSLGNLKPEPVSTHKAWEIRGAYMAHRLLYLASVAVLTSGYLISTAKGQPVNGFDWFSVPALVSVNILGIANLEDKAGEVHELLAWALIGITVLHAIAALKHHFIDKDATMLRMLGMNTNHHKEH